MPETQPKYTATLGPKIIHLKCIDNSKRGYGRTVNSRFANGNIQVCFQFLAIRYIRNPKKKRATKSTTFLQYL